MGEPADTTSSIMEAKSRDLVSICLGFVVASVAGFREQEVGTDSRGGYFDDPIR